MHLEIYAKKMENVLLRLFSNSSYGRQMKLQEALLISYRSLKAARSIRQIDVCVTKECYTISNSVQSNAARTVPDTLSMHPLKTHYCNTKMLIYGQHTAIYFYKDEYNLWKHLQIYNGGEESVPQKPVDLNHCFFSVLFSCKMRKFALAGGRCLVFPQQISTWQPGHKLSHFTAKQYTTRCFWEHFTQEIGITVAEYWFIFDQRCLVWPFDRSSQVTDSRLRDGRLQLNSDWLFSSGLWNLADAIRSTGGHRGTWCFSELPVTVLWPFYKNNFKEPFSSLKSSPVTKIIRNFLVKMRLNTLNICMYHSDGGNYWYQMNCEWTFIN